MADPTPRGFGSNGGTGDGNLSVTTSAAAVAGDLILIAVNINNSGSGAHPTPACTDFTPLGNSTASVWSRTTLLGKIATGSEGSSYTVTGFGTGGGTDYKTVGVVIISDTAGTLPTNIVTTPDASSNTTWSIPAITMAAAGSMDFACVGAGGNNSVGATLFSSWGSSLSELIDRGTTFAAIGVATAIRASAGVQSATSVTSGTSDVNAAIRVEVLAAVVATKPMPLRRRPYRFFNRGV